MLIRGSSEIYVSINIRIEGFSTKKFLDNFDTFLEKEHNKEHRHWAELLSTYKVPTTFIQPSFHKIFLSSWVVATKREINNWLLLQKKKNNHDLSCISKCFKLRTTKWSSQWGFRTLFTPLCPQSSPISLCSQYSTVGNSAG